MEQQLDFGRLYWCLVEHYTLPPEAANQILLRILEILQEDRGSRDVSQKGKEQGELGNL